MLKVKCSFLNDKFFFFHLSVQKGAFHFIFVLLFFFYQFCAEERTDFVPHFLLEEMEICVVGILDRKQCDVHIPAFSSSSCSSSPCPNGTVWSSSPWMIRNGGAAFVTKLTGQHASASSGWSITFLPIRRDSGDAAHCSGSLYWNPRKSVGGYHGRRPVRHWNIPDFLPHHKRDLSQALPCRSDNRPQTLPSHRCGPDQC